jgi:hypothetical protein
LTREAKRQTFQPNDSRGETQLGLRGHLAGVNVWGVSGSAFASIALSACAAQSHYVGLDLRPGGASAEVQAVAQRARSGDKQAQLDLGIAYEDGKRVSEDVVAAQTFKEPDIEIPEKIRTSVAVVQGQTYKYSGKYSSVVKIEKFVDSEDFNSPIVFGDNRKAGGPCAIIEAFVYGAGYGKMKFCSASFWKVVEIDGRSSERDYLNVFYASAFLREKCDTFDFCTPPPLSLLAISPPVCRRLSYYEFVGNQGAHLRLIAPSNMSNANSTENAYRAGIVRKDRKAMMRLCKSVDRRKV